MDSSISPPEIVCWQGEKDKQLMHFSFPISEP